MHFSKTWSAAFVALTALLITSCGGSGSSNQATPDTGISVIETAPLIPTDTSTDTASVDTSVNATTDTDGDGTPDISDTDDDGDGVLDTAETDLTRDTDGDGTPDISDTDDDGDGVLDTAETDLTRDTDGDGTPDISDTDDDGDGVIDTADTDDDGDGIADTAETDISRDTDGDGIADISDTDDDGDGVLDTADTDDDGDGVLDTAETDISLDTDGDGTPDILDTDDDGDGVLDTAEETTTPTPEVSATSDTDGDGVLDSVDAFPNDATESVDTDGDGSGNNADTDDDDDGTPDAEDAFPTNPAESLDTDHDGVGDFGDAFPTDATESLDTDNDGTGNNADTDDDGDGVADVSDAFPLDSAEFIDADGDGTGDNADTDQWGGATITVTTTSDVLTDDGLCSLREAIRNANQDRQVDNDDCASGSGEDTITVASGTYTLLITGTSEQDAATGDLDIKDDVIIEGAADGTTIVDGADLDRVFDIRSGSGSVTLKYLTIQNGTFTSGGGLSIYIAQGDSGSVTLDHSAVLSNAAVDTASMSYGGGISAMGAGTLDLTITSSLISENSVMSSAAQGYGGGLYASGKVNLTIQDSMFVENIAGSTSTGANAFGSGGGLFASGSGLTTNITGSSFVGNGTLGTIAYGGGIFTDTILNATNSTFTMNTVLEGSGSGNAYGGAFYFTKATVGLYNVTIAGNAASSTNDARGGGIFNLDAIALNISNSILSGNVSTMIAANCGGTITSLTNTIIYDTNDCTVLSGTPTISDPLLASIEGYERNGGTTDTMALNAGSPAINAGVTCLGSDGLAITTDQRGYGRTDGACDLGAYEANASEVSGDSDGDGVADSIDAFPNDATEYLDTDGDHIGNSADTNDDGDSAEDSVDAFPLDATETTDTDGDGIGDNSDPDPVGSAAVILTDIDTTSENILWVDAASGADSNHCTFRKPCLTIQGAIAKTATTRYKIMVLSGSYMSAVNITGKKVKLYGGIYEDTTTGKYVSDPSGHASTLNFTAVGTAKLKLSGASAGTSVYGFTIRTSGKKQAILLTDANASLESLTMISGANATVRDTDLTSLIGATYATAGTYEFTLSDSTLSENKLTGVEGTTTKIQAELVNIGITDSGVELTATINSNTLTGPIEAENLSATSAWVRGIYLHDDTTAGTTVPATLNIANNTLIFPAPVADSSGNVTALVSAVVLGANMDATVSANSITYIGYDTGYGIYLSTKNTADTTVTLKNNLIITKSTETESYGVRVDADMPITLRNNTIYHESTDALSHPFSSWHGNKDATTTLINNLFYRGGGSASEYFLEMDYLDSAATLTLRNNLFYASAGTVSLISLTGSRSTDNYVDEAAFSASPYAPAATLANNVYSVDPRLSATYTPRVAQAIDGGYQLGKVWLNTAVFGSTDVYGNTRFVNGDGDATTVIDIGAVEKQ